MGLPLYRAPVESDLKAKVPKDPPTRARSTIRRTRRNINGSGHIPATSYAPAARFHAYRVNRNASPDADPNGNPWDNLDSRDTPPPPAGLRRATTLVDPSPFPQSSLRQNDASRPAPGRQTGSALREVVYRNGMSQDMARHFGEHMAMLHAATNPRPSQPPGEANESRDRAQSPYTRYRSRALPYDRPTSPPRQLPRLSAALGTFLSSRATDASARPGSGQPPERVADVVVRREDGHVIAMRRLRSARPPQRSSSSAAGDASQQQSPFDGLGDRDRSLSPENDNVWDTLLSSITPDPQPPSVGTSFASTSAPLSASTSQTTDNSAQSSNTSLGGHPMLTDRDVLNNFDFDSFLHDNDNHEIDTDCDEDVASIDNQLRRYGRSYADVVARSRPRREDDDSDLPDDAEMQHIVRTLARREDIPDEWWAEVGLSRSLPRDAAA